MLGVQWEPGNESQACVIEFHKHIHTINLRKTVLKHFMGWANWCWACLWWWVGIKTRTFLNWRNSCPRACVSLQKEEANRWAIERDAWHPTPTSACLSMGTWTCVRSCITYHAQKTLPPYVCTHTHPNRNDQDLRWLLVKFRRKWGMTH